MNFTKQTVNWKYIVGEDTIIKKETVPGNMRPTANGVPQFYNPNAGNEFAARPIKHWRKQRTEVYPNNGITKTRNLESVFQVPGGSTVVAGDTTCEPCENQYVVPNVPITYRKTENINNKIGQYAPETFHDYSDYVNQCANTDMPNYEKCVSVCDPEHKARKRVQYPSKINKNPMKPKYYQSNASYLRGRCKTIQQNSFNYTNNRDLTKCENLANPEEFRPNCQGCLNCNNGNTCNQKVSYYKPNNCKFAVQGGVSSSSRMARLKYDTINTFANGFVTNPNFGPAVANAYAYSGRPDAPFTIKNKMFNCSQNAGLFRRTGKKNINC